MDLRVIARTVRATAVIDKPNLRTRIITRAALCYLSILRKPCVYKTLVYGVYGTHPAALKWATP